MLYFVIIEFHNNKLLNKNNPLSGLEVNQDIFDDQIKFLKINSNIISSELQSTLSKIKILQFLLLLMMVIR